MLDVGCGTGELTEALYRKLVDIGTAGSGIAIHCMGMDADPRMIAKAQEQHPHLHFFVRDVRQLQLDDEPVDVIFSNAALHWVLDAEKAVAAMARALKPGGQFVVEFGGKGNVAKIVQAVQRQLQTSIQSSSKNTTTTTTTVDEDHDDDADEPDSILWYFPSISEYTTLLDRHGIEVHSAMLFDRPTPLEDGEEGLKNWLRMFGSKVFHSLHNEAEVEDCIQRVSDDLRQRSELFDGRQFTADYRRIRVIGRKLW